MPCCHGKPPLPALPRRRWRWRSFVMPAAEAGTYGGAGGIWGCKACDAAGVRTGFRAKDVPRAAVVACQRGEALWEKRAARHGARRENWEGVG